MVNNQTRPVYETYEFQDSSDTQQLNAVHVQMLEHCDRIHTYEECGWFIVLGFQGQGREERLVVAAHAHTSDEYQQMLSSKSRLYA